ncbi:general secretion pathway protein GspD [Duganella sp. FT109W]|uniref:General secretion pathway protein GspD n=2 Tax=Duganella margarita TaxID=2692170 RepID=A0ABW9WJZ0_9BURK|nr:general secretion pathway protein GspD [Duganella margarita]
MAANDYAKGVAELVKAAELKPEDIGYRNDWLRARETATAKLLARGAAAAAEGKSAEAEQSYQAILKFDRDNARAVAGLEALNNAARAMEDSARARTALKQGDLAQAGELAARALQLVPGQAEANAVRREIESLQAQEMTVVPTLGSIYKKPINLEFRDASIKMVFDALSRTTGINFIFDRDVRSDQRTTVFLKQTKLDDAIDVILSTAQLEKKVLNQSSVLIYPNLPAKTREYQDLLVKVFYLANIDAKQAATMLKTVLRLKDVYVDDKYNMLILRETPESIALAERLIALQDLEEPEVMLDVEVLEINRSRLLNMGIQWTNQFTITPLSVTTTSNGSAGSGGSTGSVGTSVMKLSDLQSLNSTVLGITPPSATVSLQKTNGDANLLANPRIRVRDREKAKIMIGDKVPVVTTTSNSTFVTENIQYLDVGLKLEVEPDIHVRDEIGLKLALEVSSLVSSTKTNNGSQAYQIGTRNVNTALRLKDGETQILAGLINDEDRSSANRIPLLGDLPVLGRLFGSQSDNRQKTEIVLSITPHLIRNIQRKGPAAETFWSGTEATLRNRPLQLRSVDSLELPGTTGRGAAGPTASSAPTGPVTTPTGSNAPQLSWSGPTGAKAGETVKLALNMESVELLRAASLQLAFDPAELEVLAVEEGDYFGKDKGSIFSQAVDAVSGRVSVSLGANGDAGNKGAGRLFTLTVKPRINPNGSSNGTGISVVAMMPIGSAHAVGRPGLPLAHPLAITR